MPLPPIASEHLRLLEAVLFAAAEPLSEAELARRVPADADLPKLLTLLQAQYAGRGVNLFRAGASWAFGTAPDLAAQLTAERRVERKLSRAAIETLAIIAYHQPLTRAEIEDIRGVQVSKGTLDALMEQKWVAPRGRRETPGRPLTWGTTDAFLRHFGLKSLAHLPSLAELRAAGFLDPNGAAAARLDALVPRDEDGDARAAEPDD